MNPYTQRSIIRHADRFFGRGKELEDIFTRLQSGMSDQELPQSCSIVGPRRIGKSSLLYHLCQPETYRRRLDPTDRFVFVFIDLQELPGLTIAQFLKTLLERVGQQVDGAKHDTETPSSYEDVAAALSRYHDLGWRIVVCLDEFERLVANPAFDEEFFTHLRFLGSTWLAFVVASRQGLYELCHKEHKQGSQFWNICAEVRLGLMRASEARELCATPFFRAGATIEGSEIAEIMQWAGTHPFFLQIACYHLFRWKEENAADGEGCAHDWPEAAYDESLPHFASAWRHLTSAQQEILVALAEGRGLPTRPGVLRPLLATALITRRDPPNIFSGAFRRFVLEDSLWLGTGPEPQPDDSEDERRTLKRQIELMQDVERKLKLELATYPIGEKPIHLLVQLESQQKELQSLREPLAALS